MQTNFDYTDTQRCLELARATLLSLNLEGWDDRPISARFHKVPILSAAPTPAEYNPNLTIAAHCLRSRPRDRAQKTASNTANQSPSGKQQQAQSRASLDKLQGGGGETERAASSLDGAAASAAAAEEGLPSSASCGTLPPMERGSREELGPSNTTLDVGMAVDGPGVGYELEEDEEEEEEDSDGDVGPEWYTRSQK
eukprot:CAMPEP_0197861672 /NCGR_PEP_ID=MMETSP1438-20131217/37873_1 /TAXON_ID=1461541 /ORGANISM="Pterosperma sp., Strain CCMP1384" /LENGTH=195 /DNA_ID=CAMNT_0043478917 /DNA_START=24 /DNA_END=608 /DNA_ORIENTATION=+